MNEKNRKVLDLTAKYFKESDNYKRSKTDGWEENERMYAGDHWAHSDKKPVKNLMRMVVEAEVPILTDSQSTPQVVAVDPERQEDAKVLDSCLQYTLDQQNFTMKDVDNVRESLAVGPSFMMVGYDPDGDNGEGAVTLNPANWRFIWADPTVSNIDDAAYLIEQSYIRIEELKRRYPKSKDKIMMSGHSEMKDTSDNSNYYIDETKWSPTGDGGEENRFASDDLTTYRKTWFKDYSEEKIPEDEILEDIKSEIELLMSGEPVDMDRYMNHEAHLVALAQLHESVLQMEPTEETMIVPILIENALETHTTYLELNPDGTRPKYLNNMRLLITTNNHTLVLYDGGIEDSDDGLFPIAEYYCYKTKTIYSESEIQHVKSAQKSYNDMDFAEYVSLRLNSNPGWLKDNNSGVSDASLTNKPGLVVTKNQGSEVKRFEPGVTSPQLASRKADEKNSIQIISGMNEISQGSAPSGVTAARAFRTLQEQSVGRVRMKTRIKEQYTNPRTAKLVLGRVVKNWTNERKLRVYDADGSIKYIDFTPDMVQDLKYDVKAVPGTTAGLDKESIFSLYNNLLNEGKIDVKTFFSVIDIPYKQRVLESIAQNDETQMMVEQLAAENEEMKAMLIQNGLLAPPEEEAPV